MRSIASRAMRAALPMPLLILPGCETTTASVRTDAVARAAKRIGKGQVRGHPPELYRIATELFSSGPGASRSSQLRPSVDRLPPS